MALSWTTAGDPHRTRPTPPPPNESYFTKDAVGQGHSVDPDAGWRRFRFGLLAVLLVFAASVPLTSVRLATWSELTTAVATGHAQQVRVAGAMPQLSTGTGSVDIRWRDDTSERITEVMQVQGEQQSTGSTTDRRERVRGDLAQQLRDAGGGRLDLTIDEFAGSSYGPTILGWRTPVWVLFPFLALWAGVLALVASGPRPWWATRWAWVWLVFSPLSPLTLPLFLLVSGSPPGVPQAREPGFRLTGGWAFLIMTFFGGAIAAALRLTA